MPSAASWPLLPEALTPTTNSFSVTPPPPATVQVATQASRTRAFLGCGLLRPFRRDQKRDFANACGPELVRAAVAQVLGTYAASNALQGELPWRTEFGSLLYTLMYDNVDEVFRDLARVYVQDALAQWEPRVIVTDVEVGNPDATREGLVELRVLWDLIEENVDANNVVLRGQVTTLVFGAGNAASEQLVANYTVGSTPV